MTEDAHARQFELWAGAVFGAFVPTPNARYVSTFSDQSAPGRLLDRAMAEAGRLFETDLLIDAANREGDVILAGNISVDCLGHFGGILREQGHAGRLYGFDLYNDVDGETRRTDVERRVAAEPQWETSAGWYAESFEKTPAQRIGAVSYARLRLIHAEPMRDVLEFLADRVIDGMTLQIDHFGFDLERGAALSLRNWIADNASRYAFQFLALNDTSTLYLRLRHR